MARSIIQTHLLLILVNVISLEHLEGMEKEELVTIWQSKVKGHCDLTDHVSS